jgi:hypothetical protein
MQKIRDITENEMVSVFLKAEANSSRWGSSISLLLKQDGKDKSIINTPDLDNNEENSYRKKLLGDFRGYEHNTHLFETFPKDVKWQLVKLSKAELERAKYMKYDYWDELSNKTRLAKHGAESVRKGVEIYRVSNEGFLKAAEAIKNGVAFPSMIFITKNIHSDIIVLEGHQRITAHFLVPESLHDGLEVILGFSDSMDQWDGY